MLILKEKDETGPRVEDQISITIRYVRTTI